MAVIDIIDEFLENPFKLTKRSIAKVNSTLNK